MFFFPQNLGICHSGVRAMMQTVFKNRKQTWVKHIFMQLLVDFKLLRELNSYFSLMENVPKTTMNSWQRLTQVCADQYSWNHLHFKLQFVIRGELVIVTLQSSLAGNNLRTDYQDTALFFFLFQHCKKYNSIHFLPNQMKNATEKRVFKYLNHTKSRWLHIIQS